jgi:hypothetical protein
MRTEKARKAIFIELAPARPFRFQRGRAARREFSRPCYKKGRRAHSGSDPLGETTLDPWLDDPFPDYDTEPVVAFSAT